MKKIASVAIVTLASILGLTLESKAGVIINLEQMSGDIVGTATGTLNTTDLSKSGVGLGSLIYTGFSLGSVVGIGPVSEARHDVYIGLSGPKFFGTGGNFAASSGSGDFVGVVNTNVYAPINYVSGSNLFGTSTWTNQTFASLGINPGQYVWTWGTGGNSDSLTLNVGSPVPEPSTLILFGMGIVGLGGYHLRKRLR